MGHGDGEVRRPPTRPRQRGLSRSSALPPPRLEIVLEGICQPPGIGESQLQPLGPDGGTMGAACPAKKSLPERIGSATKRRIGVMLWSRMGPS